MALARQGQEYLTAAASADASGAGRIINSGLQTARTLTTLLGPFLPFTADKCLTMLNLESEALQWDRATDELPTGHKLGRPQELFGRLESGEALSPKQAT